MGSAQCHYLCYRLFFGKQDYNPESQTSPQWPTIDERRRRRNQKRAVIEELRAKLDTRQEKAAKSQQRAYDNAQSLEDELAEMNLTPKKKQVKQKRVVTFHQSPENSVTQAPDARQAKKESPLERLQRVPPLPPLKDQLFREYLV